MAIAAGEHSLAIRGDRAPLCKGLAYRVSRRKGRLCRPLRGKEEQAKRHGKQAGILPHNEKQAAEWLAAGFNVISWSVDISVYRDALAEGVRWLRAAAPHAPK